MAGKKVWHGTTYYGPFTRKEDGRKYMTTYKNGHTSSILYARFEEMVRLGHKLGPHQQVDHINSDRTDDRASNHRVVSEHENIAKGNKNRDKEKPINRKKRKKK